MTETNTDYRAFLESKFRFTHAHGFAVDAAELHPILKPHQRDIVIWGCQKGRAAYFANFGLGKSMMQLETMRLCLTQPQVTRALILCPLGVRQEFAHDAAMLGQAAPIFVRRSDEVTGPGLYISNYESVRDGRLDAALFEAVSLDEASVLRSYGSKTYQSFLQLFDSVPFRFVATATPSPNKYKELIHYAGFLGVMDTGQALTRFFQRDSEKANNLTLYPHMETEFFAWLHSWAVFVQSPADLGYDGSEYVLPPLHVAYHEVSPDRDYVVTERDGQGLLMPNAALGLKEAAREKRDGLEARLAKLADLIPTFDGAPFIVWCDLNDEQDAVEALLDASGISYSSVYGSLTEDEAERRVLAFKAGETTALIGKAVMLGAGLNLQRCAIAVFLGITYKFNDFAQAIHRIHRFGQTMDVRIHVLHTEAEREVLKRLREKWADDDALRSRMQQIICEFGLAETGVHAALARSIGTERREVTGQRFRFVNNDCVEECKQMATDSVHCIVTSIPFGNHYEYSASYNDFGHNDDNVRFFEQMDYLTPNLLRVLAPGRMMCIHTKDRIRFGNTTGYGMPSVEPFHADCIAHYRKHGFIYCGMITIVTDVVRENNQTYRLGWSEQCKDGSKMGVGSPEYVLLFRKLPSDTSKGYADTRVAKDKREYTRARWQLDAHAFWRSSGNRLLTADELAQYGPDVLAKLFERYSLETIYNYRDHVTIGQGLEDRGALPATFMCLAPASHDPDVWHDVQRMRTLNGVQSQRGLAMHVCPLQIDIVERLIHRYTSEHEVVFDPFGGIGTVPFVAIGTNRIGRGVELNASYFTDAVRYCREAEEKRDTPTLFDMDAA